MTFFPLSSGKSRNDKLVLSEKERPVLNGKTPCNTGLLTLASYCVFRILFFTFFYFIEATLSNSS